MDDCNQSSINVQWTHIMKTERYIVSHRTTFERGRLSFSLPPSLEPIISMSSPSPNSPRKSHTSQYQWINDLREPSQSNRKKREKTQTQTFQLFRRPVAHIFPFLQTVISSPQHGIRCGLSLIFSHSPHAFFCVAKGGQGNRPRYARPNVPYHMKTTTPPIPTRHNGHNKVGQVFE